MFRHQGKIRTVQHNLRIATILSFVAGIVNITGFLSYNQLTTNVTGHFSLLIYDVGVFKIWGGIIYFFYIFSFFLGSFSSSFLIEKFKENGKLNIYVLPTVIESFILFSIAILGNLIDLNIPDLIVCLLLFAMGLQNSFVTKISSAVVRTTHLTGLITDLGIDVSQLFLPKLFPKRKKLKANIRLRLYIISSFFIGGLLGGLFYSKLGFKLNTLLFASLILIVSLFYDDFRFRIIKTKRKYIQKRSVPTYPA